MRGPRLDPTGNTAAAAPVSDPTAEPSRPTADGGPSADVSDRRAGPDRLGWAVWAAGAVGLAYPLLRMLQIVRTGPVAQYADYWPMIATGLRPNGMPDIEGVLTFRNEHPMIIPKLVYWLNAALFDGSNVTLGLYVVAVVAAQVALVGLLLRDTPHLGRAARVALLVAAGALLFTRFGAWNFMKSMSGAAWLTANTFALAAVALRHRGHQIPAVVMAVAASISYGSGLAAWPAVLVVGLCRDRKVLRQLPTVVSAAVVGVWYLWRKSSIEGPDTVLPSVRDGLVHAADVISAALTLDNDPNGPWVGLVAVIMAVVAVGILAWRRRIPEAAGLLGILVYGLGGAALIAVGRAGNIFDFNSNRHASLGAMVWLGAAALLVMALRVPAAPPSGQVAPGPLDDLLAPVDGPPSPHRGPARPSRLAPVAWVVAVPLALLTTLGGGEEVDTIRKGYADQDALAVALRFGLAGGGTSWLGGLETMPTGIEKLLRETGHYPYSDRFDLDCGLAREQLPQDRLDGQAPAGVEAELIGKAADRASEQKIRFRRGWLTDPEGRVSCIVAVDADGVVIGAGAVGPTDEGYGPVLVPPPGAEGFTLVRQHPANDPLVYLVIEGQEDLVRVPGPPG